MEIEGVATQDPCGVLGCERLNSVTTILAKRTGDTPHLGGDQIPTPTDTSEDSDTLDYVTEPLWPSGVALSVDEIDDGKIDTFAPFLEEKPSQDDLPKGPEDFLNEITFEGDESFQRKLRELCSEYSDIFSDQLAEKSASLKPFEINIPLKLWIKRRKPYAGTSPIINKRGCSQRKSRQDACIRGYRAIRCRLLQSLCNRN